MCSSDLFGAGHVIDVLRGKTTDKVVQWGHASLSTFGIGTDLDEATWRAVFRQLVAQGLLGVDHDGFGALHPTEASRAVLRGEQQVLLRRLSTTKPARARGSARQGKLTPGEADAQGLAAPEAALWEKLRQWRGATAKAGGVPAYVVFHDATLAEIARARPQSEGELARISGVGAAKLARYGPALLELLRE